MEEEQEEVAKTLEAVTTPAEDLYSELQAEGVAVLLMQAEEQEEHFNHILREGEARVEESEQQEIMERMGMSGRAEEVVEVGREDRQRAGTEEREVCLVLEGVELEQVLPHYPIKQGVTEVEVK